MKKAKKSIGIVLVAILLILCLAVDALAVRFGTVITRFWSGTYASVQTETDDTQLKATDAAAELTETIAEEGIVLMKNNGLLPMAPSKDTRSIALLGYASYSPMYIGAGSVSQAGSYVSNEFIDFYDAFETAGYTVNKDMKAYYAQYDNSNGASGDMSGSGWSQATGVDDGPLYGDSEASVAYRAALEKAKAEAQTAVLVFSRVGAEGGDCELDMTGAANGDAGKHYLKFQQTELDLINYAMDNFENVIVVINFFTEEYLDKAPTYVVTLLKDGQQVEQIELTAEQVVSVEVQEESSSGDPEISIKSSASIHFSKEGDSVTVQVISKDGAAYYDSEVSAPIPVLDEAPVAEPAEAAGEATSGEGGEAGSNG